MIIASAGIVKDKKGGIIIFPYWKDEHGVRRNSMKYIIMDGNYTEEELGENIIKALQISRVNEQETIGQNAHLKASGLKSWNAFQKKYESVSVVIVDGEEWEISRHLKKKDHSYGLDKDELDKYIRNYKEALESEELGKEVLEMFALD